MTTSNVPSKGEKKIYPKDSICYRCGSTKEEAKEEPHGCSGWGVYFHGHLWNKEPLEIETVVVVPPQQVQSIKAHVRYGEDGSAHALIVPSQGKIESLKLGSKPHTEEGWEIRWRNRERRKKNLKTGCASCGRLEDHGVNSRFTHQYDDGIDVRATSDESFIANEISLAEQRGMEKVLKVAEGMKRPDWKGHFIKNKIDRSINRIMGYNAGLSDLIARFKK
jgi:hypothetical protein